jgi:predicted RNase H-like nuclease
VPNATGSRPVDKVAGSLISWLGGGVQPANRSKRGMFDDLAPIWRFKAELGAVEDTKAARSAAAGVYLMEVFPALAIPSLAAQFCGRLKGAKYNPGRRKTFLLEHWLGVLDCAAAAGESLGISGLSAWCRSHRLTPPRKAEQDLLDAVLCAIIGYIWLFRDRSESLIIGDLDIGYMVAPAVGEARDRLLKAAAQRGVRAS